ncbi:MAG: sodium:solute symporter family protein, partial [Verrucomicrobiae bacterium]|nr:sodium:solute symporter family protein [Verrucomicrobiae bacterium]
MIANYYGDSSAVRIVVAFAGFFYVILYVVMQIKAGGYLAQVMFPGAKPVSFLGLEMETFQMGATVLSLVTMIYVLIGGMRSVAWTDVLQGFLLLGGMILAAVATIVSFGGFSEFFSKVATLDPEAMALPGPRGAWNSTTMFTICAFASIGSLLQPGQWIRMYAARDDKTLKRSSLVFSTVLPACFLLGIMLVALGGRAIYPPEVSQTMQVAHPAVGEFDQIVVVLIKEQLPVMLGGFGVVLVAVILVAILAASMSTADSNLHALSAVLTRDVYDRFVRPEASETERAWVGRIVIVVTTLFALWLVNAMHRNPDYEPLKMIADLMFAAIATVSQLLPATIDILYLRKGTRAGVLSGMIAGLFTVSLFTPFPKVILTGLGLESLLTNITVVTGMFKSYFDIGFCGMAVNVVVFVLVSRFTRKLNPADVELFRKDMGA